MFYLSWLLKAFAFIGLFFNSFYEIQQQKQHKVNNHACSISAQRCIKLNVNMLVFIAHNVFVIEVTSHRKNSLLVFVIAHPQLWLRQKMKEYDKGFNFSFLHLFTARLYSELLT